MTKRTKRYGGFLIGDKVALKKFPDLTGEVVEREFGYIVVKCNFNPSKDTHFSNWVSNNQGIVTTCYLPHQLINLTRIEECERNKEQLDKFTRKHFNQSADEYLKEDVEMTKKIIRDFCKPLDFPVFDWRATDFGEIQEDFYSKGLLKEEHLVPKSGMNERLKEQNINDFSFEDFGIKALCEMFPQKKYYAIDFLKQWLSSYPTYTRDVYTSTNDY